MDKRQDESARRALSSDDKLKPLDLKCVTFHVKGVTPYMYPPRLVIRPRANGPCCAYEY
jgi:hypothetical protein